jgi:hypothetical protein
MGFAFVARAGTVRQNLIGACYHGGAGLKSRDEFGALRASRRTDRD